MRAVQGSHTTRKYGAVRRGVRVGEQSLKKKAQEPRFPEVIDEKQF